MNEKKFITVSKATLKDFFVRWNRQVKTGTPEIQGELILFREPPIRLYRAKGDPEVIARLDYDYLGPNGETAEKDEFFIYEISEKFYNLYLEELKIEQEELASLAKTDPKLAQRIKEGKVSWTANVFSLYFKKLKENSAA